MTFSYMKLTALVERSNVALPKGGAIQVNQHSQSRLLGYRFEKVLKNDDGENSLLSASRSW